MRTHCTSSLLLAFIWYLILLFVLSGRQFEHLSLVHGWKLAVCQNFVERETHSSIKSLANNKWYLINYNKRHTELLSQNQILILSTFGPSLQTWTRSGQSKTTWYRMELKQSSKRLTAWDSLVIFTATYLFKLYTLCQNHNIKNHNQHEASFINCCESFLFYFCQYCQANIWQV